MTDRFPQTVGAGETDVGLRNFMLGTYRWMAMAMAVAGVVSYFLSNYLMENVQVLASISNPFVFIIAFFAIIFAFGAVGRGLQRMSQGAMIAFLFAMAAALGALLSVSLAYIGLRIGDAAMFQMAAKVFFMTVAMFAALSLFGYSTEMNLATAAKFAAAIFIGIVLMYVASMFGLFEMGTGLHLGLSIAGVIVVGVLIAWETQALKSIYYGSAGDTLLVNKLAVFGAASLLLSFYNMFQFLMNIMSIFGGE